MPPRIEFVQCHLLGGALLFLVFRDLAFPALGFNGVEGAVYAACFSFSFTAFLSGISLAGAADVRLAQDQLGITEQIVRVCRQFFDDGRWRTRCYDRDDDDRDRDRRVFRERDRDRDRDRYRDRDRRDCVRVGPAVVCN